MTGLRTAVAYVLVVIGLAATLLVQTMGYAGRDVLDGDRFADVVVATLATPDGQEVVAREVAVAVDAIAARQGFALPERARASITAAVTAATQTDAFANSLRPPLREAHERVLRDPSGGARVELASLRPDVERALAPYGARVTAAIPSAEEFPVLVVPVPEGAGPALEAARTLRDVWPLAILVMVVAFAAALLIGPRPDVVATAIGVGLLACAVMPLIVRVAAPMAAAAAAPEGIDPVARELARQVTAGWVPAMAWTAGAGVAMLFAGRALAAYLMPRRRRSRARR